MKVVKITAVWCSGCLIMNKVWNNILKKYNIDTLCLDYDVDEEEVMRYSPGDVLPVFIFYSNQEEVKRLVGEIDEKAMLKEVEEVLDEENN